MSAPKIFVGDIMLSRGGTLNPALYPNECFESYSIPAFDASKPDLVLGSHIGSTKQLVKPGDVLLSKIVPHVRRAWAVPEAHGKRQIASSEWIVFRSNRIHPAYLRHVLVSNSFHAQFMNTVAGIGGSLLRARPAFVRKIQIPLPPMGEQQRIAEVLDRADALRGKRDQALALLEGLVESAFFEMFGDPIVNDRGWPVVSVRDFVRGFDSGKNLVSDDASDHSSRFRVLKTSAITSLRFRAEETKPVPNTYEPPARHLVREGDLLFGRANTGDLIGATALVREVGPNVLLPDKIWRFAWPTVAAADPRWVMQLFRTSGLRREMTRRASGTSESMKNISQEKVLSIRIGLPDLHLQRAYAEKANAIEASHALHERTRGDLGNLFTSLQKRAFAGEL